MKIVMWACAVYWVVMLVSLVLGYVPSNFTVGCAMLLAALSFVNMATNR